MEGQRIGSYKVVRKIGQGGMGAVYEAVHEQLGRRAAIKLLRRELSVDPQIAERFFREAKAASRVEHAGVVGIYEFGNLPDGTAYIIMEFLRGDPLSVRLRSLGGRLPYSDTVRISRQIASALAATHGAGIVHRDLKPDNVMLVPDPEIPGGERVKILDFGIAKILAEYEGPASEEFKTQTGMVLGTATYMAPEQCKGAGQVTDKADVYSLGIVMYRMCCGQVPFRADGQGEVMAMHIFSQPKPLRERDPSVPEVLANLVGRMIAKDPAERPNMAAIAQELEKMAALPVIQGSPVVALTASVATDSGNHSSSLATLSAALGQSGSMKAVPPPQRRWGRVAGIGLVLLAIGGIGAHYGVRAFLPAAQPQAKVYWTLNTIPVQAQVVRKSDGQVVGMTPWTEEPRPGTGHQVFTLRAPGFAEQDVEFDENHSASPTVGLRALPAQVSALADGGTGPGRPDEAGAGDGGAPRTDLAPATGTQPAVGVTGPAQTPGQTPGATPGQVPGQTGPNGPRPLGPRGVRIPPRQPNPNKAFTDDDIQPLKD
ncbi:MAG: protein kinase [Polyangia bacterium]